MLLKHFLTVFLFLLLLFPAVQAFSQKSEEEATESELVQSTPDSITTDKKAGKKKKNVVIIDDKFFTSLGINLAVVALIMIFIYYPNYKKLDCVFTFIIFNIIIFLLTFVLKYVKLSVGTAFGMFAVFGMLRYRTEGLSIRDMTYLFICIALGLISAIQLEYYKLIVIDVIVLLVTFLLDGNLFFRRELCRSVQYENIFLIRPDQKDALMRDLKDRTGLDIHRITISKINFLKDTATIKVYYYEKS
ncbi:MAG: DUF4956 domain-containing protein [Bacteroidota bacterium]|nr:DUF4956 domain-containing protein [Bacteroidota bacterium]